MKYIRNRLAIGLFLLSGPPLLSQMVTPPMIDGSLYTAEQRSKLLELADSLKLQIQSEKQKAEALARKLGQPLSFHYEGKTARLVGLHEDGTLRYYVTTNSEAARTISTHYVQPGGGMSLSLTGSGITLGVWDGDAVVVNHQEFTNTGPSRVTQMDYAILDANSHHATHVSGTMIGAGVGGNIDAKGMAYEADLWAYDWDFDYAEMPAAAAMGLQVSNHSYSDRCGWSGGTWWGNPAISTAEDWKFGFYTSDAADMDNIAYNAPYYLIVKAAGNDRTETGSGYPADGAADNGYDCISTWGVSKNILTVGAVHDIHNGYYVPGDVNMTSFSSWGPADDGRIKPDIVANGHHLYSASTYGPSYPTNYYDYKSGTSMAAPNVSGSLGLLLQHQQNLHGSGRMLSSTLKGLVIHTADEAGPNPGPDYKHGWGLMNTSMAAHLMTVDAPLHPCGYIREYELQENGTIEYLIRVDGSDPLRVTACWTDSEGTPVSPSLDPTTKMLVNDLDIRVIGPSNTTYYPWTLDPTNPSAAASTGDNNTDNVEQVFIASPAAGTYRVRITHKGSLAGGSQTVSIITGGNEIYDDLNLYNYIITNQQYYQATNTITAGKFAWFSGYIIDPPGDVLMEAGTKITLTDGFHAKDGSKFHARIVPCAAEAYGRQGVASQDMPVEYPVVVQADHRLSHYPNPASEKITITYTVENAGRTELTITDIYGNTVARLVDKAQHGEGTYNIDFNTSQLTPGVYFYSIHTSGYTETRKMLVVH